jgi:hypothetical protein
MNLLYNPEIRCQYLTAALVSAPDMPAGLYVCSCPPSQRKNDSDGILYECPTFLTGNELLWISVYAVFVPILSIRRTSPTVRVVFSHAFIFHASFAALPFAVFLYFVFKVRRISRFHFIFYETGNQRIRHCGSTIIF